MPEVLRHEYLICYDIENSKIRTKVYNELSKYGMRAVQKSVFWGYLTSAEYKSLNRFIHSLIEESDRAFITKTNFNSKGYSSLIGHSKDEFTDWGENYVI